jgi:GT2 family glycosyltransferase
MKDPLVSIIIITCNRSFLLQHCLQRVLDQQYPHKELIVVDSSTNDETERVVAQYPEVISVRLHGQRNNMPQARNEGIAVSSGDIIAFIDDDSMIFPGWLNALVDAYRDETVGSAGGRIVRKPEPYRDQVMGTPTMVVKSPGIVIAKDFDLASTAQVEVDHLIGCNMSFRRKALEQVGGFDPTYTLTNLREETDLCVRVKKAGWRIVFVPAMTVVHVSARSNRFFTELPSIQFSSGRNSSYFAIKHFGLSPGTIVGQIIDVGRSFRRAGYYAGLFIFGAMAHAVGRVIGLGVGISWHMSSQRRAASALEIGKRPQSLPEERSMSSLLKAN